MSRPHILNETWCVYCQRDHGTPAKLQAHIKKKHEGTWASKLLHSATTAQRIDPGMQVKEEQCQESA